MAPPAEPIDPDFARAVSGLTPTRPAKGLRIRSFPRAVRLPAFATTGRRPGFAATGTCTRRPGPRARHLAPCGPRS